MKQLVLATMIATIATGAFAQPQSEAPKSDNTTEEIVTDVLDGLGIIARIW